MVDEKLRKALDAYGNEEELSFKILGRRTCELGGHAYDKSIIGITDDGRLVYDFEKMVHEFMEDEDCSYDDAYEWLDYNTMRAIPYMGEGAPIVIMESRESLLEKYGE